MTCSGNKQLCVCSVFFCHSTPTSVLFVIQPQPKAASNNVSYHNYPETKSSPVKINGWKMIHFLSGAVCRFSRANLWVVSGSVVQFRAWKVQGVPSHQLYVGAHNSTSRVEITPVTHLFSAIYRDTHISPYL